MIEEVDAWSAALTLLDEVGAKKAFEVGGITLTDIMSYAIKTRIPPDYKAEHE